jgi:hypothetical protein
MPSVPEIVQRLAANAETIYALVRRVTEEQGQWKPDTDVWSLTEVMGHLHNEERMDFRIHLKEMFSTPPLRWGALDEEFLRTDNCGRALDAFVAEREASIAWLMALQSPDWNASLEATFGPDAEKIVFTAGDMLASWVAHDHLHIRQINELLYAWNMSQAYPYSVRYAGGW